MSAQTPASGGLLTTEELAEAVARRVVELLDGRAIQHGKLALDQKTQGQDHLRARDAAAATLAAALGVSRAYVYEHADELGAQRLEGEHEGVTPLEETEAWEPKR